METLKLSKENKQWQGEFEHVQRLFPDAKVFEVNAAYEVFHAIVDGVRLIFYPHTTKGTRNQHIRVRNGTPPLKNKFTHLVCILQNSVRPSCTFSVKNDHKTWREMENYRVTGEYIEYWINRDLLMDKAA